MVEVSGACNLRCISCPRSGGRPTGRNDRLMGLESFKQVVDKIRREDAFVGNLQLYQWGEPTLNRHLPDMIRYAREVGMLCTVSSNLNHPADFRALMASRPECLRISVSGTGERYAITHTGGNWDVFASHVDTVAALRRALCPDMRVELYYHRYRHSTTAHQDELADMCRRYDFEFHPIPAYLISLGDVLSYCEGTPLPEAARRARELLEVDIDHGLARPRRSPLGLRCAAGGDGQCRPLRPHVHDVLPPRRKHLCRQFSRCLPRHDHRPPRVLCAVHPVPETRDSSVLRSLCTARRGKPPLT